MQRGEEVPGAGWMGEMTKPPPVRGDCISAACSSFVEKEKMFERKKWDSSQGHADMYITNEDLRGTHKPKNLYYE
jgi:hypothetical protein